MGIKESIESTNDTIKMESKYVFLLDGTTIFADGVRAKRCKRAGRGGGGRESRMDGTNITMTTASRRTHGKKTQQTFVFE